MVDNVYRMQILKSILELSLLEGILITTPMKHKEYLDYLLIDLSVRHNIPIVVCDDSYVDYYKSLNKHVDIIPYHQFNSFYSDMKHGILAGGLSVSIVNELENCGIPVVGGFIRKIEN